MKKHEGFLKQALGFKDPVDDAIGIIQKKNFKNKKQRNIAQPDKDPKKRNNDDFSGKSEITQKLPLNANDIEISEEDPSEIGISDTAKDENMQENEINTPEIRGITTKSKNACIHAMIIAGQIEGHFAASPQAKSTKYEQCIPDLVAIEESDEIDGLLLLLNTIGGDIEAGLAIAELVAGMTKPTVSLVLGGGHSIGVPLAVSAKKSFIVPSATMTLHPVRLNGLVIGVPQTFTNLAKMQDRIVDFIVKHSKADADTIIKLITRTEGMTTDIGTVLEGEEAVKYGIIDSVGGIGQAVKELKRMIDDYKKEK